MKTFTIESLIVYGICPGCKEMVPLVSILDNVYKCTNCGNELKQHVNGVIKYLPMDKKTKKDIVFKE
jgi:rRNA maturation endonuclease Nob1